MEADNLAVNTIRCLAADIVSKANSGHPGAPLGLAPAAHVLWSKFYSYEKDWINRDRFVLGPGHASALMYSLLHLYQRELTIDDLKQFRQLHAKCAGHPEHYLIHDVEATTGPLGQGIGYAIGMAALELNLAARFNKPDFPVFNHKVFAFVSDGEMMEGVQAETASWAGHQKLDNLIVLYDDNHITIDGNTNLAFTEDVLARYRAYGWHTLVVENADKDLEAIEKAINQALELKGAPVLIDLKTTIGFGSEVANTPKVHGTPLNKDQLAALKKFFGFNPEESFVVPEQVYKLYDGVREKAHQKAEAWRAMFADYAKKYPEEYAQLDQILHPNFTVEEFKKFMPLTDEKNVATRVASGVMLNAILPHLPGLIGGSADLTPSNNTALTGQKSFQPDCREGRYLEFGIREHGMIGIANGMQFYGLPGLVPFVATFFTFIQYGLGALRVAALDKLRMLLIMTHDSIGLGEDGPTHQNVENFAMIRALPNTLLLRPADILETSACYTAALTGPARPAVFALSRQNAPPVPGVNFDGALKGGYIVKDVQDPKLIFVATGTELKLAYDAAEKLGLPVRVVSMPCTEIFEEQSEEYKKSVLPGNVPTISIEAGIHQGWEKYSHVHFGVETFGLSAPAGKVYDFFGLTPEKVAERAQKVLDYYSKTPVPDLSARPQF
ncbi:transketolase family protein [Trichomonas vaginalis G3]|uniref:transketolase n=1 Tax=Trichomonas vaginalis (strain ATCC PRA-98 / G3) TaxID=412133 RepID=A2EIF8_TRIV3|nr:transketolase 1-related family [Trichomonas vaginalis G3]EAY07563.1 transketolase family protein [Trichomonas vaginalis G3]KAI5541270.1 transketolase 1-related family [Trichomonas vaginalis G3]|eukprot:XP_001319786.1 transketolase family protein [Trichomonas vaginalis G3]